MGRPPSNGAPSFRFNQVEVTEMDSILRVHNYTVPNTDLLEALAQKFSSSAERSGKMEVLGKQVWNWFQNRRHALRTKASRTADAAQWNVAPVPPQTPQPQPYPSTVVGISPQVCHPLSPPSAEGESMTGSDSMQFEARSARDGAWYDVTSFRGHRSLGTEDQEVLVRFAGFSPEEDEWVSIRKYVRQRSVPCESSDCVAVLPGDLVLCFQDIKKQALYFNGHVILVHKRRHDARGCRCRFLVRYDHDQSEEMVPLKKVCRRPETDYRLQQLRDERANLTPQITVANGNELKVNLMSQTLQMQPISQEIVLGGTLTTQITSE